MRTKLSGSLQVADAFAEVPVAHFRQAHLEIWGPKPKNMMRILAGFPIPCGIRRFYFQIPSQDCFTDRMNARRKALRAGTPEPEERLLREILGYLNFSGGKPDPAFQRNWNALLSGPSFSSRSHALSRLSCGQRTDSASAERPGPGRRRARRPPSSSWSSRSRSQRIVGITPICCST